jgi:hypothetical protein
VRSGFFSCGFVLLITLMFVGTALTQAVLPAQGKARRSSETVCSPPAGGHIVTVRFKGLFFFSFPNANPPSNPYRSECTVGILSTRQDHSLHIKYKEGARIAEIEMPHASLQDMPSDISIDKMPTPSPGVTIHHYSGDKGWGKPRNRYDLSNQYDDIYDFNWILDFEGTELHTQNVQVRPNKLRPVLHIKVGNFYNHTMSPYKFFVVQEGRVRPFGYVSAIIGVCVTLARGEYLQIRMNGSNPVDLGYEDADIILGNVRPGDWRDLRQYFATKTVAHVPDGNPHEDEMKVFYDDLLELADERKRFHFIPIDDGEIHAASLPFICYAAGGSEYP